MAESAEATPSSSPKDRIKFLCSHGGRILPRPPDGQLKYVGGETRVIAVPRDITFSELMKKLSSLSDGEIILKYQVIPEDLDTLVCVTSDEDVQFMLAEYDRQDIKSPELNGSPKLRAFLFQTNPTIIDSQMSSNIHALEQRYINAINGILHTSNNLRRTCSNSCRPTFTISSAGSSPKSYPHDAYTIDSINQEAFVLPNANQNCIPKEMPKVYSSPSLYNLGQLSQQNPCNYSPQHGYYLPARLLPTLSSNANDYLRHQMGPPLPHYYPPGRPLNRGNSEYLSCGHGNGCRVYTSGEGVETVVAFPPTSMGT